MLQCLRIIWPRWNFQRELLPVLKPQIPEHLRLHESSTEYPFLPQCTPFVSILIFKTKQKTQAQAKGHFYLKPGEWGSNTRDEGQAVWWGILLLVCVPITEDCEPVPFLRLEMEPISCHLGEETLCYPVANLKEGVLESPEDTHFFRVSILSIFKMFYIY